VTDADAYVEITNSTGASGFFNLSQSSGQPPRHLVPSAHNPVSVLRDGDDAFGLLAFDAASRIWIERSIANEVMSLGGS
jgi:hypothetical protein